MVCSSRKEKLSTYIKPNVLEHTDLCFILSASPLWDKHTLASVLRKNGVPAGSMIPRVWVSVGGEGVRWFSH